MYNKSIGGGHDSKEDTIVCVDLMKWKIKSNLQETTMQKRICNLMSAVVTDFIFTILV